jgi:hypothetical protein
MDSINSRRQWPRVCAWLGVAVALIAGFVWWFGSAATSPSPSFEFGVPAVPSQTVARGEPEPQPLRADVDLQNYGTPKSGAKDIPLPRRRLHLALSLVRGSEPGEYGVDILDAEGRMQASTAGHADVREARVVLQITLDLRTLSPGLYEFCGADKNGPARISNGSEIAGQQPAISRAVPNRGRRRRLIAGALPFSTLKTGRRRTLPAGASRAWRHGRCLGLHCSYP